MKTVIIHSTDFDINDEKSIKNFNKKLQKIEEPFEVKFSFSIAEIPQRLFLNCYSLKKITIPPSVTKINDYAFFNCVSLKELTLPDSITQIKVEAFENCPFEELTLPSSIETIESYAFWGCKSLTEITIPPSMQCLGNDIFWFCCSLKEINIPISKKDFFKNVKGAENFYNDYENEIFFNDKSLDTLLLKNNSLESVINTLEER